jgi:leucine dehydrogenase
VFAIAEAEHVPTYLAADRLAEQRINAVGSMMRTWPEWPNK